MSEQPALYELLSDTAAALVRLPRWQDRNVALAHFARELVSFGLGAGLDLGELRRLGVSLQNSIFDAMIRPSTCPACGAGVPTDHAGDKCPACGAALVPF